MAVAKTIVTIDEIQRIAQQIVDKFHPKKIILFGSYADGQPTEDSDVDLLIVMDTDEQPIHTAARISASIHHAFAIDILVFRPADLEASLERKGVFTTEVMSKGIVLYEDRDERMD
jgi:uncharacterized protein